MKLIYLNPSVSFIEERILKQICVRSRPKELPFGDCSHLPAMGCFKHDHGNSLLCPKLFVGHRFRSSFTGLSKRIRHHLDCKSTYALQSTWSRMQVVLRPVCREDYWDHAQKTHRTQKRDWRGEQIPWERYTKLSLQIIYCMKTGEDEAFFVEEGKW